MSVAAENQLAGILERESYTGPFFLHGEAARLRDEAARRLADAALDPAVRDFNLDVFRGGDVTPESLVSSLSMPPVMAPRRVVVLYEAERLPPKACAAIEEVLPRIPADVTFIVTATIPAKTKKAFYRRLKEACTVLEWKAPHDSELPGWLMERAESRYAVALESQAARALAGAVGADLGLLDSELEKLAGAAANGRVTVELVRELVPNVREVNRWEWVDLVASRDYHAARRKLQPLLASPGESAVGLLIALIEHHLLLGVAVEGGARLVSRTLDLVGKPYLKFKSRALGTQARQWTAAEIEEALYALQAADRRAKTGASDTECLEELLLRLEAFQRRRRCA